VDNDALTEPNETVQLTLSNPGNATLGLLDTAMFQINDDDSAPVAIDDAYSLYHANTLTVTASGGVLANDSDPNNLALTAVLRTMPSNGTVNFQEDGSFAYTPEPGFVGVDSFTYIATSTGGESHRATVTIQVGNHDPSVTSPGSQSHAEGATVSLQIQATDPDGDSLTFAAWGLPDGLTLNPDTGLISGTVDYLDEQPPGGYPVEVMVSDPYNGSSLIDFTWTITDTNRSPTATPDTYGVASSNGINVSANFGLLANDSDPDGDSMMVMTFTQPSHGTVTVNANGSFVYDPTDGYTGSDSFTYQASDGALSTASVTVTLTIHDDNQTAHLFDDAFATEIDEPLTVSGLGVLANDYDPDGDPLIVTLVTTTQHGTLTLSPDGTFTYHPDQGFEGIDEFSYTVSDGSTVALPPGVPPLLARAFLYVTSVQSVTFEMTGTTGTLSNDNPAHMGGGWRFFPDAQSFAERNPLTSPQRNIVRIRATLPNWIPVGVPVYFRSFDVDDPLVRLVHRSQRQERSCAAA
jgi:VCBS repeat-containing protein